MVESKRPRILMVTRNMPPLVGGMERLNWHMAEQLSRYVDVKVIGPTGASKLAPSGVDVHEVPLTPLWRFLAAAQIATLWQALRWRPNIILAGSGLTALPVRIASWMTGARAVAYVHGLDIVAQHWIYRCAWLPALIHMDRVIANSRATVALAQNNGINASHIGVVNPGVDLGIAEGEPIAIERFRDRHLLYGRVVLLSLGRLSERKGLREFVIMCLPAIVARCPDVLLLIAGAEPKHALNSISQSPESILAAAREYGVADNVRFIGAIGDAEAAAAFEVADVYIFPIRELPNDPEGFGMVAIEAAAHGVPTVAFAAGGVTDAVAEGKSGFLVAPGDYSSMVDKVIKAIDVKASLRSSAMDFARGFSWPLFGQKIMDELFNR